MKSREKKTRDLNEQIFLPVWLIYRIQKYENWVEVIALYVFYFEQALRQRTNQVWATDEYCWKGLKIGKSKFQKAKKVLKELKVIQQFQSTKTDKLFGKTYIQINYLDHHLNIRTHQNRPPMENKGSEDDEILAPKSGIQGNPSVGEFPDASKSPSNAYLIKNNLLPSGEDEEGLPSVLVEKDQKQTSFSNDKEDVSLSIDEKISPSMFESFWAVYPKQESMVSARREWDNLCRVDDRPTWREIKRAIIHQKQSERWQTYKYIASPARWINEKMWTINPASLVDYSKKVIECPFHDGKNFFFGNQSNRQACMTCEDRYEKTYDACRKETNMKNKDKEIKYIQRV